MDRWERREQKRRAVKQRMPKHGARLAQVYANATLKRVKKFSLAY